MSDVVYAVPGVTPKGGEIADLKKARATARAHGVHVFAYRKGADGSLTMLGSQSPNGRVIKYEENPLKEFSMPAYAFDRELRRMGQTGHTVYRDLKTGVETKKPKMVFFESPEGALQALAVFFALEGVDTRAAQDLTAGHSHAVQAAVSLADGRTFSSTLSPSGNDYWIMGSGIPGKISWGSWAQAGTYPTTPLGRKKNPATSTYGYWVHIKPDRTFIAIKTGPGRAAYSKTAVDYLRSMGLSPSSLLRGGYGADYNFGNERGAYYWETPEGQHVLTFWYDLDYIKSAYRPAERR